jgi:hypothetical protein
MLSVIMLSAVVFNVIILSVIILSVAMLNAECRGTSSLARSPKIFYSNDHIWRKLNRL